MKIKEYPPIRPYRFHYLVRMGFAIVLLIAAMGILPPQQAHAANITVNTVDDEDNSDGDCSLREAIFAANNDTVRDACNAGSGDDVIDLSGLFNQTIILGGSELAITSNLTITGPGAYFLAISGNFLSRIFSVSAGVTAVISDIYIKHGNHTSEEGGGIINAGKLTINRCIFDDNQAVGSGGAIANIGELTINSSAFYANVTNINGGAIDNFEGKVFVYNSTFSENRASEGGFDNYGGGAISNMSEGDPAELTIDNATISNNSAKWGGGISNFDATLNIKNTIVVDNQIHAGGAGPNCFSSNSIASSFNLESGTDCGFTGTGDLQNADAKLGPLQDSGGTTWTHALLADSPAIDAGSCTDFAGNPVITDQRGKFRLSPCDIGAYEYVLLNYLPVVKQN